MASKEHQEAMDYIYDRADFDEDESEYTECEKCSAQIQNYENPVFVVGIYVDNIRVDQKLWCKKCAVKGMKWSAKHPLLREQDTFIIDSQGNKWLP